MECVVPATEKQKIQPVRSLAEKLGDLRRDKRIVHCHGVFDLLHIGHIRHLEQARKFGDLLVVTVTPDKFVNKGPGRPAFDENLRAEALAALDCVDYVAINEWPKAIETIQTIKPNVFVKGSEYRQAEKDHTNGINEESNAARAVGAEVMFTDDIVFSSSTLINKHLSALSESTRQYLQQFTREHGAEKVVDYLLGARELNVLVIGDAIIDEYQYCQAIGKSSKEPILAVKRLSTETFAGGILAAANHVAGFSENVSLTTVLGRADEAPAHTSSNGRLRGDRETFVQDALLPGIDAGFFVREEGPTITKRRFIDHYFFQKLFEVYEIDDTPFAGLEHDRCCDWLENNLSNFDLAVVLDFGHGSVTDRMINLLCEKAKFLAVNAQSNAGNIGYHTVSKYARADLVCIAENEMRLEARDRYGSLEPMVSELSHRLACQRVVVTRGAQGSLCFDRDEGFCRVPALAVDVKDRMGAGDTFMAVASLCAVQGAPMEIVGFAGNAAGAQAVATVGHRRFLERVPLIRQIECLLK